MPDDLRAQCVALTQNLISQALADPALRNELTREPGVSPVDVLESRLPAYRPFLHGRPLFYKLTGDQVLLLPPSDQHVIIFTENDGPGSSVIFAPGTERQPYSISARAQ